MNAIEFTIKMSQTIPGRAKECIANVKLLGNMIFELIVIIKYSFLICNAYLILQLVLTNMLQNKN